VLARVLLRTGVFLAGVFVASIVIFTVLRVLPGDPAQVALGVDATPEGLAQARAEFGTDRPLPTQYLSWAEGLLHGDFGRSYLSRSAIGPQIADRLQVTGWLVASSIVVALLLAVPLATFAAMWHRTGRGALLAGLSQVGVAVPAFIAGVLLVDLFAVRLRWLPSGGWVAPDKDPAGFIRRLILPVLSLGLIQGAVLSRYIRSAVLDVLDQDYLRTARAKGLRPYQAMVRHGLRNVGIPVVTVLGLQVASLLVSGIVVERVFVIPGLGSLLLDSVANRDLLVLQDVVMVLVFAVLTINFLVDVAYAALDPRLRRSS